MTANVTLRMDEDLLREVKHRAVDDRKSLSAWVADTLRQTLQRDGSAAAARERALARLDAGYSLGGQPLARGMVHER